MIQSSGASCTLLCFLLYLGSGDQPAHAETIRQHYVFLVKNLATKHSGLVDELYQAEVLGAEEMESINCELTSFSQNKKLLSMLSRKTNDQFDKFLDALDNTGQRHVCNHITGRQRQFTLYSVYYYYLLRCI